MRGWPRPSGSGGAEASPAPALTARCTPTNPRWEAGGVGDLMAGPCVQGASAGKQCRLRAQVQCPVRSSSRQQVRGINNAGKQCSSASLAAAAGSRQQAAGHSRQQQVLQAAPMAACNTLQRCRTGGRWARRHACRHGAECTCRLAGWAGFQWA